MAAGKAVLFVECGPADRATAAAAEFAAVAGTLGLPYTARAVAVDPAGGLPHAELNAAAKVVGFDRPRLEPLLGTHAAAAEFWDAAGPGVAGLVARLLGGRVVSDDEVKPAAKKEPPKKAHTVRVGRETAGRRGKGVTTVFDLPLTADGMKDLAATLKARCGTGGTVKDARIEIQGDHRDAIAAELERLGYKVKRTGGVGEVSLRWHRPPDCAHRPEAGATEDPNRDTTGGRTAWGTWAR